MAPLTSGPPPVRLVEQVVRALALPGVTPGALSAAARDRGSMEEGVRALVALRSGTLDAAGRERWEGWSGRSLEAIAATPLRVLVRGYEGYPAQLLELESPPPVLFARGDLGLLDRPLVAVVGTRRATRDGLETAGRLAGGLASAGAMVVSGLALGIDAAAHAAAGASRTVAVLGCGVDVPYPRSNSGLYRAIAADGLLLSERLPGTPPFPYLFPERNRIIAGLSRAVVVVEAPVKSGALITADHATALARPVFAVPGPLGSSRHEGSNLRIRDREATLVTGAEEVLRAVGIEVPVEGGDQPPPDLEGVGLALWRAVGSGTAYAEDLAEAVGLDPAQGLASLLALEVRGHLRQLPGMRFVRTRTATTAGG